MKPAGHAAWLAAPALFLLAFLAAPLAAMLRDASLDAFAWLASPYVRSRFATGLAQAGLSLLLALPAAAFLAWLHHTRRIPGSRWMLAAHAAAFVLPVFVVVGGLQATVGPGGWLPRLGGPDLFALLGPLGAVALANATYNTGFAARLWVAALEERPRHLEDAARVLGAPPTAAWWRVSFPLLAPSLASTALLVLLFCMGSFGVVLILGQGEVDTLETLLYVNRAGAFPRLDRAAVLALAQVTLNGLLIASVLRLGRHRLPPASRPAPPAGRARTTLAAVLALLSLLPWLAVLAEGFRLRGQWSLVPWRTLLDPAAPGHVAGFDVASAALWSLGYAAAAASLAALLALALAYGLRRLGRLRRAAEWLAALPLAASSLALGYGLFVTFHAGLAVAGVTLVGGRTPFFVVVAHTLLAFPLAARLVVPALDRFDLRLEEAAATVGAPPWHVAARLHLAAIAPALAAAAGLAAAASLGDLGASLLLMPGDALGLTVWIHRHGGIGSFDPLARAQSMAIAGLLLLLTLAVLAALAPRRRRTV